MTVEQMIAERDTRSAALSAALTTALAAANSVKGGTASASVSALADDLVTELAAANAAVSAKGGIVIAQNLSRLPMAITSIPQGGSSVTVEPLSVTENGTYTAPTGKAYSPVTVNVPTGGSDPNVIRFTPTESYTDYTVQHSIGVVPTVAAVIALDTSVPNDGVSKVVSACTSFGGSTARMIGYKPDGTVSYINGGFNILSATETSVTFRSTYTFHAQTEYVIIFA